MFQNIISAEYWAEDKTKIKVFHDGGVSETIVKKDRPGWEEITTSGVLIAAYVAPAVTWDEVRADRNRRLAETDFHALSDVSMSDEMTAYRQALRDVPGDNADPGDISWPTKP